MIQGQSESLENLRYHLRSDRIMPVKSPATFRVKAFGRGLGDIVENGCPPQPDRVRFFGHIIQHFKGMVKIIFMSNSFSLIYPVERLHFREKLPQKLSLR